MAQDTIYDQIVELGRLEAEKILQEGEEKAASSKAQIMNDASARNEKMLNDAILRNEDKLRTASTQIEQRIKQNTLTLKKQLINDCFQDALQKMLSYSDEQLKKYVVKKVKESALKKATMKVAKKDLARFNALFSEEKNDLAKLNSLLGKDYKLALSSEPAPIAGGFLLETEAFDMNNSFESALDELHNELEPILADVLFH